MTSFEPNLPDCVLFCYCQVTAHYCSVGSTVRLI